MLCSLTLECFLNGHRPVRAPFCEHVQTVSLEELVRSLRDIRLAGAQLLVVASLRRPTDVRGACSGGSSFLPHAGGCVPSFSVVSLATGWWV